METLGTMNTPEIQLLNAIEASNLEKFRDYWLPPDAVVLACAIDPSVSINSSFYIVHVIMYVLKKLFVLDYNFYSEQIRQSGSKWNAYERNAGCRQG